MSRLTLYPDTAPEQIIVSITDPSEIAAELARVGVDFERWQADAPLPVDADQATILAAYASDIARLQAEGGYITSDVVRLKPDHPERASLRQKFLDEHTHSEDEVRFFVEGSGAFYLHLQDRVYQVTCERGDLLRVPAHTRHWFDMGPAPYFTAIRLFIDPAGWVGHFTGEKIASEFPRHGE
ncbi:1,2-dihydroxy-3-keto-5-methylthiopentene dioxygenase [Amantichitinum ursilacus]|uniref:Acireductone dioxygenase n=1 Tax=Amantichitinum ursilacus TaxID=857265 RepID=A0A0N0XH13_9NEIS|nr:hypothetical protein [Amantichitinum ursilacus]KPC50723.1 Acireductone dioxygenase [Amantichitinum ursilacus]